MPLHKRQARALLHPQPQQHLGYALAPLLAPGQVQYGYVNLEEIFRDSTQMSVGDLSSLLLAKIAATSVCVGGGLVGGLFAPSLFLGALVGDIMGNLMIFNTGAPALQHRSAWMTQPLRQGRKAWVK